MQKLKDSEFRYRRLFETAQDGILILDAETGMIEDVNPYLIKMLGYSREEFIKKKLWEVGAFRDIEASKEAFEALQENEYIRYEDLPLKTKEGRLIQVEFVSNVYVAGDEKVIQCNIRDNTVHTHIVAALQANEKKYYDLINQSPDGYFIIELSGNILTVNKAMCKELEFSEEEFLSMSIWDIIPDNFLDQYREKLTKTLKGESLKEAAEYEVRGKNGKTHYVEVLSAPRYSGKNIIGFQGIARDITARKQTEDALRESEAKFHRLVEHLPTVVYVNAVGNASSTLYVSPQIETLMGYTPEEWLSDPKLWSKTLHPEDRQDVLIQTAHTDQSNKPFEMEYRMIARDGRVVWVHDQIVLVTDLKGQPLFWQGIMLDITESKLADDKLRKAREFLQSVQDALAEHISILDYEGNIVQVNSAWRDFGNKNGLNHPDHCIGMNYLNVCDSAEGLHAEKASLVADAIREVRAGAKHETWVEYPCHAPDEQRWFIARITSFENAERKWIIVAHENITERKQIEQLVRNSEKRFKAIFDQAPIAIALLDMQGYPIISNLPLSKMLGYDNDELSKMKFADFTYPEDVDKDLDQFTELIEGKITSYSMEKRYIHKNGNLIWANLFVTILCDENGIRQEVIGIAEDITARKQSETATRQRLSELEVLYQGGLALSQLVKPKAIAQKMIDLLDQEMDWHHTAIRLYNPETKSLELLAFHLPQLSGQEELDLMEKRFKTMQRHDQGLSGWAVQHGQAVCSNDLTNDPRYFETFPGLQSGLYVPIKIAERVIGVISIESEKPNAFNEADERLVATLSNQAAVALENASLFQAAQQEIFERKKVEELLADERNHLVLRVEERTAELSLANSDLARVLRSRDEFLASMSHELRTPLTGILGFSETLQLKSYGELSEKQHKALKYIEESGRHLLDLINDILDLSKVEAGKLDLQFVPCSLADICQASLQLTKGVAQQKKQTVHYEPPAEPIILRADARRLKQILVNLLGNAIKFTPEKGELGLEVQADELGRRVKLTVWDKGIGIDPGNIHKLFKPFVQLDSSLAREYSGTGLGLSLVKRLTELHNGGIEVESVLGEGSRFTVSLPWSPQNTTPIPYEPFHKLDAPSGTKNQVEQSQFPQVMIVDDNEMVLQMIAEFLEAERYRVVKVRSGIELLERVAEIHPDIMLMDIQMPGMDGLETIRRIRAHTNSLIAAIPIIAITALAMPGDRELSLSAGANNYMSKPVRLQELVKVIQKEIEENYE